MDSNWSFLLTLNYRSAVLCGDDFDATKSSKEIIRPRNTVCGTHGRKGPKERDKCLLKDDSNRVSVSGEDDTKEVENKKKRNQI